MAVLFGADLVYITASTDRGPPFVYNERRVIGVDVSSIWSYLCFIWFTPLIITAQQNPNLDQTDLPELPPFYRARNLYHLLANRETSLFMRLLRANRTSLIVQVFTIVTSVSLYYAPAYCMNQLLQIIQEKDINDVPSRGIIFVFALAGVIMLLEFIVGQLFYFVTSAQTRVKSMLEIEIYRKALWRTDMVGEDAENSTAGTIVNLMGTDTGRITDFVAFWFNLFEAPTELAIGIYLLYGLLGNSCLLGFLVMVVMLPLNQYVSSAFSRIQNRLMEARDKRVALMNEVLQGLRQVKFFAWEDQWEKRINEAREAELNFVRLKCIYQLLLNVLWESSPILVIVISFWSFTKIEGQQLTAAIGFTSIAIFNELQYALNSIPETVVQLLQAINSFKRIEAFLQETEVPPRLADHFKEKDLFFEDATISWSNTSEDLSNIEHSFPKDFMLENVNVQFPQNKLSLICGPTGSGKTLMMLSLLGETVLVKGKIYFPRIPLVDSLSDIPDNIQPEDWILNYATAYVSQTAWLQNASIRNNILFGLPYVESRYKDTLFACALNKDLSIFEDGDLTEIGEKGITLSGGQKARVALARAVYSRAQNVLMDDVLSAVDAPTAKHIYRKCIMGSLMEGRTRILITHHVQLCLTEDAYLVYINDGVVVSKPVAEWRGSEQLTSILDDVQGETWTTEEEEAEEEEVLLLNEPGNDCNVQTPPKVLVQKEARAAGSVKQRIYMVYLGLIGGWSFWLILAFIVLFARIICILDPWWIKKWTQAYKDTSASSPFVVQTTSHAPLDMTNDTEDQNLDFYLGMYIFIAFFGVIVNELRYAVIFWGGLRGNRKLHAKLLRRVLRTSLRVLDVTPVGRFLNRFSNDIARLDDKIPNVMMDFSAKCLIVLSSIVTVSCVLPALVIPMLVITTFGVIVGRKYLAVSRECKRLDSVTHSPLLTHFDETLIGIVTIRAFGATSQFMQEMLSRVDMNAKPYYFLWIANRWMFMAVRNYTSLEMSFNAVERAVDLVEIDQEAPDVTDVRPPPGWPAQGQIEVQDLEVRYAPDLQPVLKNLTFSVRAREKVGVVGRTGSGKSTLALSLFRFLEASRGSIFVDGVNIADIGTYDLRSNLTIIPQDPTLFSGTLRSNMDPFNQFSDADIFAALRRVHLIQASTVEESNVFSDLDTPVSEGGRNFSQGQRQLLCLARALLKRANVVLMDEATASVDFQMDKAIQKTITTEFSDCTILCIAHRLHTVIEYDRILVLDQGEIKEFASPWELLQDRETLFYKMCQNSNEFGQLATLAKAKHQLVDIM
ncbi:hypothetical protein DFQ29_001398 [Apophysomyces sp. BC1021]|nr:hypothetical protein DFQ29_001398 [Apophysomyces sp. BC1021]